MAETDVSTGATGPITAPKAEAEAKAAKSSSKEGPYIFRGPLESTIQLEEGGQVYYPGDELPISRAQAVSLAGEASLQIEGPDLPNQGEGQTAAFEMTPEGRALRR